MAPRANWKGYLRLSLVSCPIALYPASSLSEKVSFNRINRKTGNRLKQQFVMLRSIADIARAEGEDMSDPETALACVQVFALGSGPGAANPSESGYFVVRGMLAKSVTHAGRFIAERGVLEKGGPLLVRFIAQVASRFGTVVTQKLAAQAIPVIGAVGGAAVNYAFIEHFQEVARGHFVVRRLERVYGKDPVRQEYERLAARG